MNIFHVFCMPADDDTVAAALPSIFQTFYDAWNGYMQTGTTWTLFDRMVDIAVEPNKIYNEAQKTVAAPGSTTALPSQLALVLSWRSDLAGPRYRGRTYLGPFNTSANADGGIAATLNSAAQDAGDQLISDIASIAGTSQQPYLAINSRFTNPTPITGCTVQVRFRTQRRRN